MGLRKFIGKVFGESDNNNKDNKSDNNKNFKYLDDLIHDDSRVIELDSDIILDDDEASNYVNGIKLDRNYLVIKGNGHTIDARNKAGIFFVEGKQIQIYNINFVNAHGMGALDNSCAYDDERYGLTITNCSFKNNISSSFGAAIKNNSPLKLVDTDFIDNKSDKNGGAIANYSKLLIKKGNFMGNASNSISNEGILEISNASFDNLKDEEICSSNDEVTYIGCMFKGKTYQDDSHTITSGKSKEHNFYNLEKLLSSSNNKVELDDDFFLKLDESLDYNNGINVSANDITVDGCKHSIDANNVARIFNIKGKNIVFKNIVFKNSKSIEGTITVEKDASLTLINCTFTDNHVTQNGGALVNFGDVNIIDCTFKNNKSDAIAGTILNCTDAKLNISNSEFMSNSAYDFAAIFNLGNLKISHSVFDSNNANNDCGAIGNIGGHLEITNSKFTNNTAKRDAGAVFNDSRISIHDCTFENNTATKLGGAISINGPSSLISKSIFKNNNGGSGSAIFNTSEDLKVSNCRFSNHHVRLDLIYNKGHLQLLNSKFFENFSKGLIIFNDENSNLYISDGKMSNNSSNLSCIYNLGFCNIAKFKFENNENNNSPSFELTIKDKHFDANSGDKKYSLDIYNDNILFFKKVQFKSFIKTVLNRGHIDTVEFTQEEFDTHVHNLGTYKLHGITNNLSFKHLDKLIHEDNLLKISLKEDIILSLNEVEFYEGGIELDVDGLEIDGCGRTIDGAEYSRIFIVSGEDITLKNIIFKNGKLINKLEQRSNGGGALKILKGASVKLENCIFSDNSSDDGGAILNNGRLSSINSKFENNSSDFCGGAVFNRFHYMSLGDEFISNKSEIAGAIYNEGELFIEEDIMLSNNFSYLSKPIYNANIAKTNVKLNEIYNAGLLNRSKEDVESFVYLNNCIFMSKSIILSKDIKFDYSKDSEFKNGIIINKNIIIDGNGHYIDGCDTSSLFNINSNVVFKNIVFKNTHSNNQSIIENNGNLRFENCKFLNNKSGFDFNLINNHDSLQINNCEFLNNISMNKSIINNEGSLEILNTHFLNNQSKSVGTCIYNKDKCIIKESDFEINNSQKYATIANGESANLHINCTKFANNSSNAGTLVNWGEINLEESLFKHNSSKTNAGAIINGGKFNIFNSIFDNNSSKYSGGAILNDGEMKIDKTFFKDNVAKMSGNSIYAIKGNLTMSNTKFNLNKGKEIYSIETAEIKMKNCSFGD